MAKEDLQTRLLKGVLRIDKNVARIDKNIADGVDVLRDLSMKLCYIIKHKGDYHTLPEGIDYSS